MARVQREYWQRRNQFRRVKWWGEFIIMTVLFFLVILIPVLLAMKYIP